MRNTTVEVLDRLQSISDEAELKRAIEWYLSKTDISIYAYIAFLPEIGPRGINNHPKDWLDRYRDEGYLEVDPVISRARDTLLPFQWSDIKRDLKKREKLVLDEGGEVGIVSGATVPVPGPGQSTGMVFFSSELSDQKFERLWTSQKYDLHMVGIYFHSAFVELFRKKHPNDVELTLRERECLLWTARGKTAADISELLKISERTVVFHIQNAMQKLGCSSKYQATLRAILTGLICP
jgi:DNA-binding CsgD family transcriptional regulator